MREIERVKPRVIETTKGIQGYTAEEILAVLRETNFDTYTVNRAVIGLTLTGQNAG